VAPDSPENL